MIFIQEFFFIYFKFFVGSGEGLVAEILSLVEVSLQTLFVLNACWRRCRGAQQNRTK